MNWSVNTTLFRNEAFLALIALALTVSNAPIFQNVGTSCKDVEGACWERVSVAGFYIRLIFSLFPLVIGRIIVDVYCPPLIKKYPFFSNLSETVPMSDPNFWEKRNDLLTIWEAENESQKGLLAARASVVIFTALVTGAFALATLSLFQFALYYNLETQASQSSEVQKKCNQ